MRTPIFIAEARKKTLENTVELVAWDKRLFETVKGNGYLKQGIVPHPKTILKECASRVEGSRDGSRIDIKKAVEQHSIFLAEDFILGHFCSIREIH